MRIVIDAQIVGGYYQEVVLGKGSELLSSPISVFERLGRDDIAFVDGAGWIEGEWSKVAESEWFHAWFGAQLEQGGIEIVEVPACVELIAALARECGFPKYTRDRRYICAALELVRRFDGAAVIVTEDLDFYEPSEKRTARGARRAGILRDSRGCVARYLRRRAGILVQSVGAYLESVRGEEGS